MSIDDAAETGVSATRVLPALLAVLAARFLIQLEVLKRFTDSLGFADGMYAENVAFFDGSLKIPFAKNDMLGMGSGMYGEQIALMEGQAILPPYFDSMHDLVNQTLPSILN